MKDLKNKTVYHGSYIEVKDPDLKKCKKGKDFGQGFYITTDKNQATRFAKLIAKRNSLPEAPAQAVLNIYTLSDLEALNVHQFQDANAEWLHCVVGHRNNKYKSFARPFKEYEVLIGKVADDNTSQVINAYMVGAYGDVGSDKAIEKAVEQFETQNLKNQICLKSEKALKKLKFVKSEIIEP